MIKFLRTKPFSSRLALALVNVFMSNASFAGTAGWAHQAGTLSTGQVVIKSVSGSTTYNGTQNPTGAVAKTNQSAVTQPPTVIIQATASLPIKVVGDACTANTTGTVPNQSANEGTAITADRSLLLSCQSGSWGKQGGTSFGTKALMYLEAVDSIGATACPLGWIELDHKFYETASGGQARRTCMVNDGFAYEILYLIAKTNMTPGICPSGWAQVDYNTVRTGASMQAYIRVCTYKY